MKEKTGLKEYVESPLNSASEWDFDEEKMPEPQSWKDINSIKFPENPWVVRDLFPREGISIMASISGEGKSILILHLAKCLAEGKPWFGYEGFALEATKVLYVNMEMSLSEVQRRGRKMGLDPENENLIMLNEDDFNLNAGGPGKEDLKFKWLLNFIYQKKIQVVIVDTFRAAAGGLKEDKAEEVRAFFLKFQVLKNSGVSVIFTEHLRKPNQMEGKTPKKEQLLGSQDKTANVEILLMIRKDETTGLINVYQRKNRLGPEIAPFAVKVSDIVDEDGNERMELEYAGELQDDGSKKDEAKEDILGLLENGEKTTKELIELLKKKVGSKNTRAALHELVLEGHIDCAKQKRENLYFLPKEAKEAEKPVSEETDTLFFE